MIERISVIDADGTDPYRNIALEECLLHDVRPGQCILYLWQNQRTVVLGRNQNALDECDVTALERDGGHLARRLSGGGAVYHDLGNLNFTFLVPTADYDQRAQTETILGAVRAMGVDAVRTGRNDLVVDGRKFSGHAYYHTGDKSYHHGTLMVDVGPEPLARYLHVSPLKLGSKGVSSVRSRVCNLVDLVPGLTVERLAAALREAFEEAHGMQADRLQVADVGTDRLDAAARRFSSREWLYRDAEPFGVSREARFSWGTVRLEFAERDGVIERAALWSDGLDADKLEAAPQVLAGVPLDMTRITDALTMGAGLSRPMAEDLARLATRGEGDDHAD